MHFFLIFQANNHDTIYDEQGMYTFKHKWLFIVNNQSELSALEPYAVNVTHVTAVSLNTAAVYNAFFTKNGRKFQEVGKFEKKMSHFPMIDNIFANEMFILNGRTLRISVNYVSHKKILLLLKHFAVWRKVVKSLNLISCDTCIWPPKAIALLPLLKQFMFLKKIFFSSLTCVLLRSLAYFFLFMLKHAKVYKVCDMTMYIMQSFFQWGPYMWKEEVGNQTVRKGLCIDLLEVVAANLNFRSARSQKGGQPARWGHPEGGGVSQETRRLCTQSPGV